MIITASSSPARRSMNRSQSGSLGGAGWPAARNAAAVAAYALGDGSQTASDDRVLARPSIDCR